MRCLSAFTIPALFTFTAAGRIDERAFPPHRIIERDVAILGAGGSGTYAAVRCREDFNLSIVVIEKEPIIGGHVDTYIDPLTNTPLDYGVLVYTDYGPARDYFKRFNIPVKEYTPVVNKNVYVDIATGKNLSGYQPPSMDQTATTLKTLLKQVKQYEQYLQPGFWDFPQPDAIPPELLIPFGDYASGNGLEGSVSAVTPILTATANVGVGGIRQVMTLYVLMVFGPAVIEGIIDGSFFVPVSGSNTELYDRAYQLLKKDLMLTSQVIASERDEHGTRLVVQSPQGRYLIKAKKLLVSVQPSLEALAPLGLDQPEVDVFSTFVPTWSFTGIIRTQALPSNYTISFYSSKAVPNDYLAIRDYPYTLNIESAGPPSSHLFRVLVATSYAVTQTQAQGIVNQSIQKLFNVDTFICSQNCDFEWVAFTDHNSVLWRQPAEKIQQGLIQDMYALQGHRSTWWTGGLWCSDYSANVWAFTDTVLPRMVRGMQGGY